MSDNNNMVNSSNYTEDMDVIDILDLFFFILRKYKAIIIAALICMLLFGAIGTVKKIHDQGKNYESDLKKYENEYLAYQEKVKAKEVKIASYEKSIVNMEALNGLMEKKEQYLEDSIYLNLDSSNCAEAVSSWSIKLDEKEWDKFKDGMSDPADEAVSLYAANLASAIDWPAVRQGMGIDSTYVDELVSIYKDLDANTVTIRAYYSDIQGAEKLRDLVAEQAEKIWNSEKAALPVHTRTLRVKSSRMTVNNAIDDARKIQTDIVAQYSDKITAIAKYLDTLKNPYESDEKLVEPKKPSAPGSNMKGILKSGIKFAIIGIIVGIFLSAGFFGFIYIAGGRVHTADELKSCYRLEVFAGPSKEKVSDPVIRFIDRLAGTAEKDRETAMKRCAIRVRRLSEGEKIIVTGTVPFDELKAFSDGLQPFISGRTLVPAENVLLSNETLGMIENKTEVLLVEKKNRSKKKDVSEELGYISDQKGKILGVVLI